MPFLLVLLLSVTLSPPFGEASARLIGFTPTDVTIEVSVDVVDSAAIVLMRGQDVAGQELDPVALLLRDDGTWGAVVELPARPDLRIVFELIPDRGVSTLSAASSLADLGIDPARLTFGEPAAPAEEAPSRPGLAWIVVGAVAGAAALALVAVWSRTSGSEGEDEADDEGDDEGDEHEDNVAILGPDGA
jgi:hypothetical protein